MGAQTPFFDPPFSFVYLPFPSPPLPLEVGPLKCSQRARGALLAPHMASGA